MLNPSQPKDINNAGGCQDMSTQLSYSFLKSFLILWDSSLPCAIVAYHKCHLELIYLKSPQMYFKLVHFVLQFTKHMFVMLA